MGSGFRNRVPTNVEPVSAPINGGTPIADALQQLGRAGMNIAESDAQTQDAIAQSKTRIALEQQRRDVAAKIADRMGGWADAQAGVEGELDTLRNTTPPEQYQAKADALITQRSKEFIGTLGPNQGDPVTAELVQRFAPLVATFSASTRRREAGWAAGENAKVQATGLDKLTDRTANGLVTNPSTQDFATAIGGVDGLIDGLDVPESTKLKMSDLTRTKYAHALLDGLLHQGNYAGARALLDKGALDAFIAPEAKTSYLQQADTAEQVAVRQQALAQSQVRDAVRDNVKSLQARIDAGATPSPTELSNVRQQAVAQGLKGSELTDIDLLSIKSSVNRNYGALVGQPGGADRIRADRDALVAKVAAGTASEPEQVMKAQLEKLTDLADHKETAGLVDLVKRGAGGQFQALQAITGSPQARAEKAEKLHPGHGFGFIANLAPQVQQLALDGAETLGARKIDFGTDKQAKLTLDKMLGPYAGALGGTYGDLLHTSRAIMAQSLAGRGRAGYDEDAMREAVRMATGGHVVPGENVVRGGLQTVRGKPVLLPPWETAGDFDANLAAQSFDGAVYANGKPVDKADVIQHYRPEPAGETPDGAAVYRFIDASGGVLLTHDGTAYTMTDARRGTGATIGDPGYSAWLQKNGIRESDDYDTLAAYRAGLQPSANGHLPDTYKRPNHMTFSNESVYSGKGGAQGGEWKQGEGDKWTFNASPFNLKTHSKAELRRYFDQSEPGNTVVFPDGERYTGKAKR